MQALVGGEVVAVIQDQMPYGNMMIIETSRDLLPQKLTSNSKLGFVNSLYILYAHFSNSPLVDWGDQVACGQTLGEVGATGYNIVNPHLHLETALARRTQILWMAWRIMIHGQRLWNVKIMNFGAPVGISATLIPCC